MARPDKSGHCSRRHFLGSASATLAGTLATTRAANGVAPGDSPVPLLASLRLESPPVLQNPQAKQMTVVWAVSRRAQGWVEYGLTKELGSKADAVVHGMRQIARRVLAVKLENLTPGTRYFYRTAAAAIDFNANLTWKRGPVEFSEVHEFTTPSPDAPEVTFSVINDTHANPQTLPKLFGLLRDHGSDYTIWNGDLGIDAQTPEASDDEVMSQMIRELLRPDVAYAASKPLLFVCGNHDVRGPGAHLLSQILTPWDLGPLGRNFVLRHGPLAIVALDTGEDKPDSHPYLGGIGSFEDYRVAQRKWLELAVARDEFKSAPCKIAITHIPLHGAWSCAHGRAQWSDILTSSAVQLLISGHVHSPRYDPPCAQHGYGQLVGGGPLPTNASIIRGHATRHGLKISLCNLSGNELITQEFRNA